MENFKSVFLESYHAVYCRAKSILNKEDDVIALMKEVYMLAAESNVADINAKSWLAKQTYILGCGKFRKKKAREAELIELQEHEYEAQKGIDCDKTKELICETLQELPDLYQATLFAFYYDQYSVKEVATVTGYSEGVIINRLNYIHKYLSKKLENAQEENKEKVQFSVEMVYEALKQWAAENALDGTATQNLYTSLCMELNLPVENILDEASAADEKNDVQSVKEELQAHSVKGGFDKKQALVVAAIVGGLAILAIVAILLLGGRDKNDEPKDNQPVVDNQVNDSEEEQTVLDDTVEEDDSQSEDSQEEDSQEEESDTADDSEYILPNSNTVRLTRADLQGLTKEELRLARNEIYARYGVIFGVADLDAYFGAKSWYEPKISLDDFEENSSMNPEEYANLSLIVEVEDEME